MIFQNIDFSIVFPERNRGVEVRRELEMLEEEEVVGNSLDDPLTSHIGGGTQASLWGSNFTKHTQNIKNTHTCSPDKSMNLS